MARPAMKLPTGNISFLLIVAAAVLAITLLLVANRYPTTLASTSLPTFSSSSSFHVPTLILEEEATSFDSSTSCDGGGERIRCSDPEVFHVLMRAAMEVFPEIHFYRFGKPAPGDSDHSCDMAWRFRPKNATRSNFFKDYRRFEIARTEDCGFSVLKIGEYHSGVNARKRKKSKNTNSTQSVQSDDDQSEVVMPFVSEVATDSPVEAEQDISSVHGKYIVYAGGGDRCKSMDHFLWSFLCSLGEARYLKRKLVVDLSMCMSKMYMHSQQDEEGKDFRLYFDFEHLMNSHSVIDSVQFWANWRIWERDDGVNLYIVEDTRLMPMKLKDVKDTLIMRKFGTVEPDNYWYHVCEREAEAVIKRPWNLLRKSTYLSDIVSMITSELNWDFDSVHIMSDVKGDTNSSIRANSATDTFSESLMATISRKIDHGRHLYIATKEPSASFVIPLKDKYTVYLLSDFAELWNESSKWSMETRSLNNGVPVEFDGYMQELVDFDVFLQGKKQIEATFDGLISEH